MNSNMSDFLLVLVFVGIPLLCSHGVSKLKSVQRLTYSPGSDGEIYVMAIKLTSALAGMIIASGVLLIVLVVMGIKP